MVFPDEEASAPMFSSVEDVGSVPGYFALKDTLLSLGAH